MPEKVELSEIEKKRIEEVIEKELSRALRETKPHEQPYAVLLAGQPGAGKTVLSSMLVDAFGGDAEFINGDDFRRYHPDYKKLYAEFGTEIVSKTAVFSSAGVEGMISALSDHHINLIVEGTGRNAKVPETTAKLLAPKGYTVELAVIATRPELSLISTLARLYQMSENGTPPRATAISVHDHVVNVLPGNLDELHNSKEISRITIWDRELHRVYDSKIEDYLPSKALKEYWGREWSVSEVSAAKEQIEQLRLKEAKCLLGQIASIDELERRVDAACFDADLEDEYEP